MTAPPPLSTNLPPDENSLKDSLHVVARRRGLIVGIVLVALTLAGVRSLVSIPIYQGVVKLLIERENPNVLNFKEVAEIDSARDDYYQTQYKLLQSRALARRVILESNLLQDPEFGGPRTAEEARVAVKATPGVSASLEGAIDVLLTRLRIQPEKNSRLVGIVFESSRPSLAAQVANNLARFYIEQTLEFRYQTSSEAGQWLGGQIKEQRAKVEAAEIALQRFKEREGISNIEERRSLLDQRLKELGTAVTTLKTQRLEKEALVRQMQETANPEELPEVMRSAVIQGLRIELAALDRKEAQLVQKFLDQHPELVQVREQIRQTRQRVAEEARRVVRAAEHDLKAVTAQETSVSAALEGAKAEALDLSTRGVQYDSLKREQQAAKAVLDSTLSRSKEADVAQELRASNIRIVDPAVIPRRPVRPDLRSDLLIGLLFGFGVSLGLVLLIENLDNTVKTPEDVRQALGVPLLGVIPEAPTDAQDGLVLRESESHGPFVESYRTLRTAMTYSWPADAGCRAILLTSAGPGEGKTLTSVNLSLTLASLEERVLLIDGDLRKPQTHAALKLRQTPGLSDVLVGKAELANVLHQVEGTRLSVVTAGTPAPSPADLLTASGVKRLLDTLRGAYDWIIIDSPPVGAVADPLILAAFVQGVIVVTAAGMLPRRAVRDTVHRISETGARLLGVLLNRVRVDRFSPYYSSYYGAYHYGGRSGLDPLAATTNQPSPPTVQ